MERFQYFEFYVVCFHWLDKCDVFIFYCVCACTIAETVIRKRPLEFRHTNVKEKEKKEKKKNKVTSYPTNENKQRRIEKICDFPSSPKIHKGFPTCSLFKH